MAISKYINEDISGFYDIGKRYSLDLYANNEDDFKELVKNTKTKNKNIEIVESDKHLGLRLLSYSVSDLLQYQKNKGLKFKLEHL